jgi:hypothetical protein
LAFESLALVSQALTLLEAGELGVVSFGEEPAVLHQLGETFNEESGARWKLSLFSSSNILFNEEIICVSRLLQQLNFNQRQTRIGKMVNFVTSMLTAASRQSNTQSDLAQLLLIVSDGRGVFSEGRELVEQAVRAAREARVFIVFLAIEDPHSKVEFTSELYYLNSWVNFFCLGLDFGHQDARVPRRQAANDLFLSGQLPVPVLLDSEGRRESPSCAQWRPQTVVWVDGCWRKKLETKCANAELFNFWLRKKEPLVDFFANCANTVNS